MAPAAERACVSLVVPCYNEAKRLNTASYLSFLENEQNTRLLFVDDGSADGTVSVLEAICREHEDGAGILRMTRNRGKAEAVRQGVNYALEHDPAAVVGFWDADLATPLNSVARLHRVLQDDPKIEMVFGSRVKLLGRQVDRRATRHYLGRVFATMVSAMLRLPIYDTQCGAKLFRVTPELRKVFSQPFLSKWVFDVEILARYLNLYGRDTKRLESAIYEYPLETWVDVRGSKVRASDFAVALIDIAKIKTRYLS
jgi:dolichyl-phosphate beta-glucosyltransferase